MANTTEKNPEAFETFLSQLTATNRKLDMLTDFKKINEKVKAVELCLNELNCLLGKKCLREMVEYVFKQRPEAFSVLNLLVAVRDSGSIVLDSKLEEVRIDSFFKSADGVMAFLKGTRLEDLFTAGRVKNLVDYVFGVEVGLDSNARKNRGGTAMEERVADIFKENGIPYQSQVESASLPGLAEVFGKDLKCFDFTIRTPCTTYLIETNYYSAGGSKLNEVARAYQTLQNDLRAHPDFTFVWITDGTGWNSAKSKLGEAFMQIEHLYNLTTIGKFVGEVRRELKRGKEFLQIA